MRPIPREKLTLVADITSQMYDVHGGPIHIGNPGEIFSLKYYLKHGMQLTRVESVIEISCIESSHKKFSLVL